MPIKAENRTRYPKDWKAISRSVRESAGDRCERCGLVNGLWGYRDNNGLFHEWDRDIAPPHGHAFRIVLTVAHLDHVPENCSRDNLRAWCQRCHLTYDATHHARTRTRSRTMPHNS